jgi:hypothetical protein
VATEAKADGGINLIIDGKGYVKVGVTITGTYNSQGSL